MSESHPLRAAHRPLQQADNYPLQALALLPHQRLSHARTHQVRVLIKRLRAWWRLFRVGTSAELSREADCLAAGWQRCWKINMTLMCCNSDRLTIAAAQLQRQTLTAC